MSAVKDHFTSRYPGGKIIQCDLSQIEVVVAAQLSGDPTLIKLLQDVRDVHKFMVANIYGEKEEDISKDDSRRKAAKPGTFGILYGCSPRQLSVTTEMDIEWCANFINTFYVLFPRIKLWHNMLKEQVELKGELHMPTGMILKFKKYPAKFEWQIKKGILESYNPPDIKNWPVQSTAQVIMALWIGKFFRRYGLFNRDRYLMINEIHDSLMLDCRPEYIELAQRHLQESLDRIPEDLEETLGIKMLVPIKGEILVGNSWAEV